MRDDPRAMPCQGVHPEPAEDRSLKASELEIILTALDGLKSFYLDAASDGEDDAPGWIERADEVDALILKIKKEL